MRNNKLYSIQFLRFIAIILVIYSHSYDRLQRYLHMSDDSIYLCAYGVSR